VSGRDYCKLHIICHHIAVLLGTGAGGAAFHVVPVAAVGNDEAGWLLKRELALAGADVTHVRSIDGEPTMFSVCFQYPDRSGGNITTNPSAAAALEQSDIDVCEPLLVRDGPRTIVLAAPEVPLPIRDHLLRLGSEYGAYRVAAFASSEIEASRYMGMLSRTDLVALNEDEASALVRRRFDPQCPEPFLDDCANELQDGSRQIQIIVTAGQNGAFALEADRWEYRPALQVPVVNTAGAGDALLAGVTAALIAGMPLASAGDPHGIASALDFGVLMAAHAVTSPHTIHPGANVASLLDFAERLGLSTAEIMSYIGSLNMEHPARTGRRT
jgi:sugar/nucleoside kinase (ribokinase family)